VLFSRAKKIGKMRALVLALIGALLIIVIVITIVAILYFKKSDTPAKTTPAPTPAPVVTPVAPVKPAAPAEILFEVHAYGAAGAKARGASYLKNGITKEKWYAPTNGFTVITLDGAGNVTDRRSFDTNSNEDKDASNNFVDFLTSANPSSNSDNAKLVIFTQGDVSNFLGKSVVDSFASLNIQGIGKLYTTYGLAMTCVISADSVKPGPITSSESVTTFKVVA
jgi:hypothetical protein